MAKKNSCFVGSDLVLYLYALILLLALFFPFQVVSADTPTPTDTPTITPIPTIQQYCYASETPDPFSVLPTFEFPVAPSATSTPFIVCEPTQALTLTPSCAEATSTVTPSPTPLLCVSRTLSILEPYVYNDPTVGEIVTWSTSCVDNFDGSFTCTFHSVGRDLNTLYNSEIIQGISIDAPIGSTVAMQVVSHQHTEDGVTYENYGSTFGFDECYFNGSNTELHYCTGYTRPQVFWFTTFIGGDVGVISTGDLVVTISFENLCPVYTETPTGTPGATAQCMDFPVPVVVTPPQTTLLGCYYLMKDFTFSLDWIPGYSFLIEYLDLPAELSTPYFRVCAYVVDMQALVLSMNLALNAAIMSVFVVGLAIIRQWRRGS